MNPFAAELARREAAGAKRRRPPLPLPRPAASPFAAELARRGLASRNGDETVSWGASAAHAGAQGMAEVVAGVPKGLAIGHGAARRELLEAFDRIDAGDTPEPRPFDPNHHRIDRYDRAAPAERARLRAHYELADPRRLGLYRAGEAIDEGARAAFPTHPEHAGDFGHVLARGAGNLIGYGASALVGGAVGGAPAALATAIGLGAGGGAAGPFEDALRHGASIADATRAAKFGGLLGATEAVPVLKALDRLDKATRGGFRRKLLEVFQGGGEEGLQEFAAHVAGNLVASDVVRYDPDRETFLGSGEATARGFTLGTLLNALAVLVGGARRGRPWVAHDARDEAGAPPPPSETLADATGAPVGGHDGDLARAEPSGTPAPVDARGGERTAGQASLRRDPELGRMLDRAMDPVRAAANVRTRHEIGEATPEQVRAISKTTKRDLGEELDVTGYRHAVYEPELRKVWRQHGGPNERDPRNVPLTRQDFELIPEIIATGRVVSARPVRSGRPPRVLYIKRTGNTYHVVEEVRRGKGELAFLTMYKVKTGGGGGRGDPMLQRSPDQTSETRPGTDDTVAPDNAGSQR